MLRIGHRGAAGYAPENTISSIRKAIELGCDLIEIDVQSTRDGVLVVFHDKLIDRVTDSSGYIWDYTYNDLRKVLVAGRERIPSLEEICAVLAGTGVGLIAEILSLGIERDLMNCVVDLKATNKVLVASFFHKSIGFIKNMYPETETVALLEGVPIDLRRMIQDSRCDYVGFGFESIVSDAVKDVQNLGAKALVWTLDDEREIERARTLRVDGIFSNYPDRIKKTDN